MSDALWFFAKLECAACGCVTAEDAARLYSDGLNPGFGDEARRIGESFNAGEENFRDAYVALRPWTEGRIRIVERWECPHCARIQWAKIELAHEGHTWYRFLSAEAVDLTPETLADAHFLSRRLDFDVLDLSSDAIAALKASIPPMD